MLLYEDFCPLLSFYLYVRSRNAERKTSLTQMPRERSQHLDIESAIQQLKPYGFGAINIKKVAVVDQKCQKLY